MSWRRFQVLVRGLSPKSATVAAMMSRLEFGSSGERVVAVNTPDAAQKTFVSLFGRSARSE